MITALCFFAFAMLSCLISFGMAILLVEKGNDFPIKKYRVILQKFIHDNIGWKWSHVLFCSVCTSFWTTLVVDLILCIIGASLGVPYFLWPFSGFLTAGFTWFIIEFLNAIDKKQNINVFLDDNIINKGE